MPKYLPIITTTIPSFVIILYILIMRVSILFALFMINSICITNILVYSFNVPIIVTNLATFPPILFVPVSFSASINIFYFLE